MARIEKLPPLLGPLVVGPLGVAHLPRMWYKSVLSAAGALYDGYFDNYKGFNQRVCDAIGLEPDAWFAFLATMPTYPEAEAYVSKNATKLNAETIAKHNADVAGFLRPEENSVGVRQKCGISDDSLRNSAMLLNMDDWHTIHQELVAHRDGPIEAIVPMISSAQVGLTDIPHLPRLWIKALLAAVGALPAGWKTGTECGFDKKLSGMIGLDLPAASAYISGELPNYLQFESWVLSNIAPADAAKKAEWAKEIAAMQKPEEASVNECIEAGAPGLGARGVVLLNDMVDWKHMHDAIVSRRATPA